jgi:D-psicose/D-tagatose/L-ribulose 3-epimerase
LLHAAINTIIAVGKVYDVGSGNVHWADIWRGLKAIKFDGFLLLESFAPVNPDLQAATYLWRPPNQPSEVLGRGGLEFLREGAQAAGLL